MLFADLPDWELPYTSAISIAAVATVIIVVGSALLALVTNRKATDAPNRNPLSLAIYLAFWAIIATLAGSSFWSIFQFGHMSGYALLIHIAAAGGFVFLLLAVATLYLPHGARAGDASFRPDHRWWFARWSAWLLVVSCIVTAGTMFAAMLPILDTQGLVDITAVHRYAGLLAAVAAVLHLYSLICTRLGFR